MYGGGVVLSSAAAVGAAYLGSIINPIDTQLSPESIIAKAFGGGEKAKIVLEVLKHDPSKQKEYPVKELLEKMKDVGLGVNDLSKCSEELRNVCGLFVRKVTDMVNRTSNPSKFTGLADQTEEAVRMLRSSQS